MGGARILRELKRDSFGRVELLDGVGGLVLRRVAAGGRVPGSGPVARLLLGRERAALVALAGLPGVPTVVDDEEVALTAGDDGRPPRAKEVLLRTWLPGEPLHLTPTLPRDFFDLLDELVIAVHGRGVCHNDLHKEQNIIVGEDGRPALIDFQLASLHRRESRAKRIRVADDLRHLQKHRRRYTRDGRGPEGAGSGAGYGVERSAVARAWRGGVKPLYNLVTRRVLGTRDGEARRPSSGPWPEWTDPVGR